MNNETSQEASVTALQKSPEPKRPHSESREENLATDTIYVSNIHPRIAEVHLQKLFGRFGEIQRVHIVRKHAPKHSFAFIKFSSPRVAKLAIEKTNGQKLLEMSLCVKFAYNRMDPWAQKSTSGDTDTLKRKVKTQHKIDSIRKTLAMKDCKAKKDTL